MRTLRIANMNHMNAIFEVTVTEAKLTSGLRRLIAVREGHFNIRKGVTVIRPTDPIGKVLDIKGDTDAVIDTEARLAWGKETKRRLEYAIDRVMSAERYNSANSYVEEFVEWDDYNNLDVALPAGDSE